MFLAFLALCSLASTAACTDQLNCAGGTGPAGQRPFWRQGSRKLLASARRRFVSSMGPGKARVTRFDYEDSLGGNKTVKVDGKGFPFSAIGQLESGCSAFLVGPCHLLTVAHCVYNPEFDFWWGGTEFHPGRSGPENRSPDGPVFKAKALVPENWRKYTDYDYDFSMLILQKPIGQKVGWLDFGYDMDQELVRINVAGYPAYTEDPSWVNGTMYYDACKAQFNYRDPSARVAYHNCDTVGGSSGSPLWVYDKKQNRREVRALHSHSARLYSRDVPTAVKFQKEMFDMVIKWKRENECPQG